MSDPLMPPAAAALPYDYPVYLTLAQAQDLRDYLSGEIEAKKAYIALSTPRPVVAVMNALGLGIKPTKTPSIKFGNNTFSFTEGDEEPDPILPVPIEPIQKHP